MKVQKNIKMEDGLIFTFKGICPDEIQCLSGHIWLTARKSEDILLKEGECLGLKGLRHICIQALGQTEILLNGCRKNDSIIIHNCSEEYKKAL